MTGPWTSRTEHPLEVAPPAHAQGHSGSNNTKLVQSVRRGVEPPNRRSAVTKSPRKRQARGGMFCFSAKFGQVDVWGNESEDSGLSKNLPMKLSLP